jgi:hypothetical protein
VPPPEELEWLGGEGLLAGADLWDTGVDGAGVDGAGVDGAGVDGAAACTVRTSALGEARGAITGGLGAGGFGGGLGAACGWIECSIGAAGARFGGAAVGTLATDGLADASADPALRALVGRLSATLVGGPSPPNPSSRKSARHAPSTAPSTGTNTATNRRLREPEVTPVPAGLEGVSTRTVLTPGTRSVGGQLRRRTGPGARAARGGGS